MNEINKIASVVTEITGITIEAMQRKSRKREILESRQMVSYIAHHRYQYGCAIVGQFWKQDHTTQLHSFKHIGDLYDTDKNIKRVVDAANIKLNKIDKLEHATICPHCHKLIENED